MRAHSDPEYTRLKARLKATPTRCQLDLPGCTIHATTLDHQPRLMDHPHVRGTGCCQLVPACHHCNSSDGASAGNTRRLHRGTGYTWP